MARLQPVLTDSEMDLVDQVAALTSTRRTDVIKNALTVYHWFVRQAVIGARVVARKPSGEETAIETAELTALEARAQLLSPAELKALGKKLAKTKDAAQAAALRERMTRGFYGI